MALGMATGILVASGQLTEGRLCLPRDGNSRVDFHGTQELVGCVVAVRASEGIDKVMPCAILGLLEVPSGAGVDGGQRLEKQGGPRTGRLVGRYDVKRIEHRS